MTKSGSLRWGSVSGGHLGQSRLAGLGSVPCILHRIIWWPVGAGGAGGCRGPALSRPVQELPWRCLAPPGWWRPELSPGSSSSTQASPTRWKTRASPVRWWACSEPLVGSARLVAPSCWRGPRARRERLGVGREEVPVSAGWTDLGAGRRRLRPGRGRTALPRVAHFGPVRFWQTRALSVPPDLVCLCWKRSCCKLPPS